MNTFLKVALGFVIGIVCTLGVLYIVATSRNTEEQKLKEEIRLQALKKLKQSIDKSNIGENEQKNIESFELSTKKGIVKLHTYMSKDSVQILMGRPQSTSINDCGYGEVRETWNFRGTNRFVDEFTIEFINGNLKSVKQYKDH